MQVKLLRRLRSGTLPRYVNAGLIAAFCGHLAFNLLDSVSPGWPGQIGFWFMAGLTVRMRRQVMGKVAARHWMGRGLVPVVGGGVAAAAVAVSSGSLLKNNFLALSLHAHLQHPESSQPDSDDNPNPGISWLSGIAAHRAGDTDRADALWRALVADSPRHWWLVRSVRPHSLQLAEVAMSVGASNAEAHFWMSDATEQTDAERSIALLRSGLALDPTAGREWLRLGDFLTRDGRTDRLEEALMAFGSACRNGDPGANGCVRAGAVAEQLGRSSEALAYYKQSNWAVGQKRARELDPRSGRLPLGGYLYAGLAAALIIAGILVLWSGRGSGSLESVG